MVFAGRNIIFYCLYFISILIVFSLKLENPGHQIEFEESWIRSLVYATKQSLQWGEDVLFTYGPWHMVSTRAYDPSFRIILIISQLYVWFVFAWYFLKYYKTASFYILLLLFKMLFSGANLFSDIVFCYIGLVYFIKGLSSNRTDKIILYILLLSSGFIILSKLSYLIIYILLMIMADIYQFVRHRNYTFFSASLIISLVVFWLLSGHELSGIVGYFKLALIVIGQYSESMQHDSGVFLFFTLFMFLNLYLLFRLVKEINYPNSDRLKTYLCNAIIISTILLYNLFSINISVRGDSTHVIVSACLLMCCAFSIMHCLKGALVCNSNDTIESGKPSHLLLIVFILTLLSWYKERHNSEVHSSFDLLFNNSYLTSDYNFQWQKLKNSYQDDVYNIAGTIDSYPYNLRGILALQLNYHPRPIIQSYSAYSPKLQEVNLAHIKSSNAPEYLLFQVKSIDGRFPTMAMGLSFLEILKRYKLIENTDLGALLKKRNTPLEFHESYSQEIQVEDIYNDKIKLPDRKKNSIRIISVDLKLTLLGRLKKLFLGAPYTYIHFDTSDGLYNFRFIPPAAKSGFILVPFFDNYQGMNLSINEEKPDAGTEKKLNNLFKSIETNSDIGNVEVHKLHISSNAEWSYNKKATIKIIDFNVNE